MQPAIFLDRDGVIIENRENYVLSWSDVSIYPFTVRVFQKIQSSPYKIIVVTNQSAVGRGLISHEDASEINRRLVDMVREQGGRIDAVYMCPHAPIDRCTCRKPEPGLFTQAAKDLGLDLSRSFMIGDALTDLLGAQRAGIPTTALVKTGRGSEQALLPHPPGLQPFQIYDTFADAIDGLLCSDTTLLPPD